MSTPDEKLREDTDQKNVEERWASDPDLTRLRDALASPPGPEKSLLPQIQRRIFVNTKGRYFRQRDRANRDPLPLILGSALLVLALLAATYYALSPLLDAQTLQKGPTGEGLPTKGARQP